MIETYSSLSEAIGSVFGPVVKVESRRPVAGGCINNGSVCSLSNGVQVFVKENSDRHSGLFEEEARGLAALRAASGPRIPEPLALVLGDGKQRLVLEFVPEGSRGSTFFEQLGSELAELHKTNRTRQAGFDRDNHIGATPQSNGWMDSWLEFFGERRLMFQARLAAERGRGDLQLVKSTEQLVQKLPELLNEPEAPPGAQDPGARFSLLHGDLWGGNYMVGPEGEPVLIDPAVYYGHREADLAMTELFGGFGRGFYAAYRESWPLDPGYEERRDLYNLYHLLNHLNLFGGGYASSVRSILKRYS